MKKWLAASVLTASLLANGLAVAGAQEPTAADAQQHQAKAETAKWKQTPEYQALEALQQQRKQLNEQLKSQTAANRELWESLKSVLPQEKREEIKNVLKEVKGLREANKNLVAQLKEAQVNKDKAKVQELKQQIAANHQAIQDKLAPYQADIAKLKELHKQVAEQVKPIRQEKKANHEKVVTLREQIKSAIVNAKDANKAGNDAEVKQQLDDAIALLQQLISVKQEILSEKQQIADILKQAQ